MNNSALRLAKTTGIPLPRFEIPGKNGEEKIFAIYPA
jgi:hypothetical protein